MWLVVSLAAAVAATLAYSLLKKDRKRLKLGLLSLMLWGTVIMIFVDHLIAFLEGGPFIEVTTGGLIGSGTVLGLAMLVPILAVWLGAVLLGKPASS